MKRPASGAGPGVWMGTECTPSELIRAVEMAESLGYARFWRGDTRFFRDAYVALTLAATRSRTILLGPGCSVPFSRHPVLIACGIATLDEISDGRAILGIGSGAAHAEGGNSSLPATYEAHRPIRALREAVELIRLLLSGEVVDYSGELFSQHGGQLSFRDRHTYWQGPVKATDRSLPIFVTCHGPQALRLAGQLADGVQLAYHCQPDAVREAIGCVRDGERKADRPSGAANIHLRLETMISDNEAHALSVVGRRVASRLVNSWPKWQLLESLRIQPTEGLKAAAEARDVPGLAAHLAPKDIRATALVGSESQVVEQLQSVLTPEIVTVTIRPMGKDVDEKLQTVKRFMEGVWPHVEGLVGSQTSLSVQ